MLNTFMIRGHGIGYFYFDYCWMDRGKNRRYFDLIDADSFNLALTKYIEQPHEDIEDSNFFMIYLKPDNLYPIEDR